MAYKPSYDESNYTVKYSLNDQETKLLISVLSIPNKGFTYGALLIIILKEVKGDVASALRIVSGISREGSLNKGRGIYSELIRAIKTAIVLSERRNNKEPIEMEKLNRFSELNIDRNFVYRTRNRFSLLWETLPKRGEAGV